jgi:hypothetical protein
MTLELRNGFTIASQSAALLILSLLACDQAAAAERDQRPEAPIKLASRSLDATPAAFTVGSPVIVTRTDVESPLTRVRSLDADGNASRLLSLSEPDPAFKSVILTSSNSTGRDPSVVDIPDIPDTPEATIEPRRPSFGTPKGGNGASKTPPSKRGYGLASGSSRPEPQQQHAAAPRSARAPARFGKAEIEATQVFTRF